VSLVAEIGLRQLGSLMSGIRQLLLHYPMDCFQLTRASALELFSVRTLDSCSINRPDAAFLKVLEHAGVRGVSARSEQCDSGFL
jgi:hypothetical protein